MIAKINDIKSALAYCVISVLLVLTMQASAEEVRFNMEWTGPAGYSITGQFAYDAATAGVTVTAAELTDFYYDVFDATGEHQGGFTFADVGTPSSVLFFTYDSLAGRLLLTGETDPNDEHELDRSTVFWGFAAGKFSYTSREIVIASRIGCGSTFLGESAPEIDIYLDSNGGCQPPMKRVDIGAQGSEILVTLADNTPRPQHKVHIEIDEDQGAIPAEGGRLQYYAKIANVSGQSTLAVTQWSVLTLPTGVNYGIHTARTVEITGDLREFKTPRITIPNWFPAGEYLFKWYVADTEGTNTILESSLTFEKLK